MVDNGPSSPSLVVINFSHPLTADNLRQIEQLVTVAVSQVIDRPTQFDWEEPFADQARDLVAGIGISGEDWQRLPVVVNLPGLSTAAAAVLADLHGRTGSFPPVLVLRRQDTLNQYAVTQILDLNGIRASSRHERTSEAKP